MWNFGLFRGLFSTHQPRGTLRYTSRDIDTVDYVLCMGVGGQILCNFVVVLLYYCANKLHNNNNSSIRGMIKRCTLKKYARDAILIIIKDAQNSLTLQEFINIGFVKKEYFFYYLFNLTNFLIKNFNYFFLVCFF